MAWTRAAARFLRNLLALLLLALLLLALSVWLFPEVVCQQALAMALRLRGMDPVEFTVSEVSPHHLSLTSVQAGSGERSMTADAVDVAFSWQGLRRRTIEAIEVQGVQAHVTDTDGPWSVAGLPSTSSPGGGGWHVRRVLVRESAVDVFSPQRGVTGRLELVALELQARPKAAWAGRGELRAWVMHPILPAEERLALHLRLDGDLQHDGDGTSRFGLVAEELDAGLRATADGTLAPAFPASAHASLTLRCDDLSEIDHLLRTLLPRDRPWSGAELAGALSLSVALEAEASGVEVRGTADLQDVDVVLPRIPLSVHGIGAELSIEGMPPLRTPSGQTVTFAAVLLPGLALEDGSLGFRLVPSGGVLVDNFSAAAFGGTVRAEPFRFDPARPGVQIRLRMEAMDLDQLAGMQSKVDCTAEGTVDGMLDLGWEPGTLPRIKGHLASPSGEKGRIQFVDPSLLTRNMKQGDARIKTVALSLRDFRYDLFRIAVDLTDEETATANLRLSGRSAVESGVPPINLNVNFEADLEDVMYLGRLLGRMTK